MYTATYTVYTELQY